MVTKRTPRARGWGADDEPVAAALAMARAYVDGARRRLAHARRDETDLGRLARDAHEARKALKRARAHLTLAAPSVDRRAAERLSRRCRDVGRLLAPARDATVAVVAFDAAVAHTAPPGSSDPRSPQGLATLRERMVQERDDALRSLRDGPALAAARSELRALREGIAALQAASPSRTGAKAWARGVQRMHGRARRASTRALTAIDETERIHAARQRWKALGSILRGYEIAWEAQVGPLATTIEDVCERIGDHHDALVLIERLQREPGGATSEAASWVAHRAHARAATLLASALPVLERLAVEPSDAFAERHGAYVRAARRAKRTGDHASAIDAGDRSAP